MKYCLKCHICGCTCWADGEDDPDTNSCEIGEIDDACEHIAQGGDYEIIDCEYPDGPEVE